MKKMILGTLILVFLMSVGIASATTTGTCPAGITGTICLFDIIPSGGLTGTLVRGIEGNTMYVGLQNGGLNGATLDFMDLTITQAGLVFSGIIVNSEAGASTTVTFSGGVFSVDFNPDFTDSSFAGDGLTNLFSAQTSTGVDLTPPTNGGGGGLNGNPGAGPFDPAEPVSVVKAVPEFSSVGIIAAIVVIAAVGAVIVLKKKKQEE
jgi:hypothetical protein